MKNDQLTEAAKLYGQQLGALIAMADIPEEQKEAWMALLPEMSFEQLDRLRGILEQRVAGLMTEEFSPLISKIQEIKDDYERMLEGVASGDIRSEEDLKK